MSSLHSDCQSSERIRSITNSILQKKCALKHPPGRKVYQRGAHIIWEVDGAKEKVCNAILGLHISDLAEFQRNGSFTVRTSPSSGNCS